MTQHKGKHVIFLGAGASATSGYPMAKRLTLLMADRRTLLDEILQSSKESGDQWEPVWFRNSVITQHLDSFQAATGPLRNGAFATVDELSRLSFGTERAAQTRMLKKLVRFIFALYNPHHFGIAKTDYRSLIQALFGHSSRIREDISILSFNYDPYLEFSLRLAFLQRQRINADNPEHELSLRQAITSGLENFSDQSWLDREGFCHLKLHGTCVFPGDPFQQRQNPLIGPFDKLPLSAHDFFSHPSLQVRLPNLSQPPCSLQEPPILFPWEIIHESGRLLSREEFLAAVSTDWQHAGLYELFTRIWQKAKMEVQAATRISFIGLSMSPFLEPAARYLFSGKTGATQIIVANPDNERFVNLPHPLHPRSPSGRIYKIIGELVGPEFQFLESVRAIDRKQTLGEQFAKAKEEYQPKITTYNSFSEFIEWELK